MANVPISDLSALSSTDVATGDQLVIVDVSEALDADKTKNVTIGDLFPWAEYTPSYTGFSSDPTIKTRYAVHGKVCIVTAAATANGTSNATSFTMSAPFTAATVSSMIWANALAYYVDSGSATYGNGRAAISSGSSTITLSAETGPTGWTSSGNKAATFMLIYEIA